MFAKSAKKKFAAKDHLLCRDRFVHLLRIVGCHGSLALYFRLGNHNKNDQVAGEELASGIDHLGRHGGFGEIGDPDDQSALLLKRENRGGGADVVGLGSFGSNDGELLDQLA